MAKSTPAVNPYDPEVMRARFWAVKAEMDAVDEELAPLQSEAAEIANYRRDREIELNELIKGVNQRRYDLQVEAGRLSNALSGRTGASADEPYDGAAVARFHAENPPEAEAKTTEG